MHRLHLGSMTSWLTWRTLDRRCPISATLCFSLAFPPTWSSPHPLISKTTRTYLVVLCMRAQWTIYIYPTCLMLQLSHLKTPAPDMATNTRIPLHIKYVLYTHGLQCGSRYQHTPLPWHRSCEAVSVFSVYSQSSVIDSNSLYLDSDPEFWSNWEILVNLKYSF